MKAEKEARNRVECGGKERLGGIKNIRIRRQFEGPKVPSGIAVSRLRPSYCGPVWMSMRISLQYSDWVRGE
jgi:hypothetical protein